MAWSRAGKMFLRVMGKTLFVVPVCLLVLLLAGYACGMRFNLTTSLPTGIYRVVDKPVERGAYVRFCPMRTGAMALAMERGYLHEGGVCADGFRPLLKRVAGVEGDHISARDSGVWVDGRRLPLSDHRAADGAGRPMPKPAMAEQQLTSSQLWVMSDTNPRSFDSRYFGPIERAWVMEVLEPVITWGPGGTLSRRRTG